MICATREYIVGESQQQKHTFTFDEHTKDTALELRFYLEAYATLDIHLLIMDVSVQIKLECILRGEGAHARIHGAYLVADQHSVSIDTVQHHVAAHTSSTLIMKGVLRDQAYAQYHGTIRVEKDARGSCASQENKNILLSDVARVVSVPNLEVLTHEVKCFHGSAIGKFDPQQLFYMAARGMHEKIAEKLLLQAFLADVLDDEMLSRLIL